MEHQQLAAREDGLPGGEAVNKKIEDRKFTTREDAVRDALAESFWPVHDAEGRLILSNGQRKIGLLRKNENELQFVEVE